MDEFFARGWVKFPHEPALARWAAHADVAARAAEADAANARWRLCGGTWFAGVNALENDSVGRLPGGPPLTGAAIDAALAAVGGGFAFDRAQASVIYPGYPKRGEEESEAAFRYRRHRDAAHVDGLHRVMPGRRRMVREVHGFILGLPLNEAPAGAAPFTIWEGSHRIIRSALAAVLSGVPPETWAQTDVTEAYQAARRLCFETLPRVEIAAAPGEAYLVHRLALHGVAPWRAGGARRAVAYFRPDPHPCADWRWWLSAA
ncbi:hypothetical protein G5B40_06560 [Pikeienuella piscinae]|uniref:Phytanoyl-CoA dioxygenase n=1 Tax=Pikeienuella piscinae TaxID=2748098 RepID=A0A7L5BU86_9RHOB|nr:hypothetical protein [Pikeienuella piscinae]QIE55142.1 hypothetical protein G5B40_06560 [Pikeienuella piscinae]